MYEKSPTVYEKSPTVYEKSPTVYEKHTVCEKSHINLWRKPGEISGRICHGDQSVSRPTVYERVLVVVLTSFMYVT